MPSLNVIFLQFVWTGVYFPCWTPCCINLLCAPLEFLSWCKQMGSAMLRGVEFEALPPETLCGVFLRGLFPEFPEFPRLSHNVAQGSEPEQQGCAPRGACGDPRSAGGMSRVGQALSRVCQALSRLCQALSRDLGPGPCSVPGLQPPEGSPEAAASAELPQLPNLAETFHTVNLKQKCEYGKNISCFWMCLNKTRLLAESRQERGKNSAFLKAKICLSSGAWGQIVLKPVELWWAPVMLNIQYCWTEL